MKLSHPHFNEALGHRIKAHRRANGMTMDELAKASGTAKSTIHAIEHANSMPSLYTFVKICDAMSLDISQLVRSITHPQS